MKDNEFKEEIDTLISSVENLYDIYADYDEEEDTKDKKNEIILDLQNEIDDIIGYLQDLKNKVQTE